MFFMGYAFASGTYTLDSTAMPNDTAQYIRTGVGDYDHMYIGNNPENYSGIPSEWGQNTVMNATFNNTLASGNTEYFVENTDALLVKRRVRGDVNWITLHKHNIASEEDFSFVYVDKTARSDIEYEYAIVPVFGGSEGSPVIQNVIAEFEGVHIIGVRDSFHSIMEVDVASQRRRPTNTIQTMNRKYPFVVQSGIQNYSEGTVEAMFVQYNSVTKQFDFNGARVYRNRLYDFLLDGEAKILKTDDGRMWLIQVTGDGISETKDGVKEKIISEFSWTEIADCDNEEDLAVYGFAGTED